MMTYTTVFWITCGVLVYGAMIAVVIGLCASPDMPEWESTEERVQREEKERVLDRMREGRY